MSRGKREATNADALKRLLETTNSTPAEIAGQLGISPGTVRNAIRKNEMTVLMARAVEGLQRRLGKNSTMALLVSGPPHHMETVRTVAASLSLNVIELEV